MIHWFRTDDGQIGYNGDHLSFRNDPTDEYVIIEPGDHGIINREIGDREMYLDNVTINREGIFHAEERIIAGNRVSPFYNYPNINQLVMATNSKDSGFIIDSFDVGEVLFKAEDEIRLVPGFESRRNGQFHAQIDTMNRCFYTLEDLYDLASVPFMEPLKMNQIIPKHEINVYPNPTSNLVHIVANNKIEEVRVFDLNGKVVYQKENLDVLEIAISLEESAAGTYILEIKSGNKYKRYKLMKQL